MEYYAGFNSYSDAGWKGVAPMGGQSKQLAGRMTDHLVCSVCSPLKDGLLEIS